MTPESRRCVGPEVTPERPWRPRLSTNLQRRLWAAGDGTTSAHTALPALLHLPSTRAFSASLCAQPKSSLGTSTWKVTGRNTNSQSHRGLGVDGPPTSGSSCSGRQGLANTPGGGGTALSRAQTGQAHGGQVSPEGRPGLGSPGAQTHLRGRPWVLGAAGTLAQGSDKQTPPRRHAWVLSLF